jgi:hypothetical protein
VLFRSDRPAAASIIDAMVGQAEMLLSRGKAGDFCGERG